MFTALGHDLERVDVEAGVGLVEHCKRRLEHGHLKNLVALLLTAAEPVVHRTLGELVGQLHQRGFLFRELHEVDRVERVFASVLSNRIERGLQEIDVAHARNGDRVLKAEEEPLGSPQLGGHLEQISTLVEHPPIRDFIAVLAGEHVRQRALARTVRPHDGVDLHPPSLRDRSLSGWAFPSTLA